MARPRKEIDQDQFEQLCNLQCTGEEIAGFFKCSVDTIERWCVRTYNTSFAEAFKLHSQKGKISLRRLQFKLAERSYAMAIWLGKQYLGQTEKIEQVNSFEEITPLADLLKSDEVDKLKAKIKELEETIKELKK